MDTRDRIGELEINQGYLDDASLIEVLEFAPVGAYFIRNKSLNEYIITVKGNDRHIDIDFKPNNVLLDDLANQNYDRLITFILKEVSNRKAYDAFDSVTLEPYTRFDRAKALDQKEDLQKVKTENNKAKDWQILQNFETDFKNLNQEYLKTKSGLTRMFATHSGDMQALQTKIGGIIEFRKENKPTSTLDYCIEALQKYFDKQFQKFANSHKPNNTMRDFVEFLNENPKDHQSTRLVGLLINKYRKSFDTQETSEMRRLKDATQPIQESPHRRKPSK